MFLIVGSLQYLINTTDNSTIGFRAINIRKKKQKENGWTLRIKPNPISKPNPRNFQAITAFHIVRMINSVLGSMVCFRCHNYNYKYSVIQQYKVITVNISWYIISIQMWYQSFYYIIVLSKHILNNIQYYYVDRVTWTEAFCPIIIKEVIFFISIVLLCNTACLCCLIVDQRSWQHVWMVEIHQTTQCNTIRKWHSEVLNLQEVSKTCINYI